MLLDPVPSFLPGDEEERLRAREDSLHLVPGLVVRGVRHLGTLQLGRPRCIANDEALRHPALGEPARHPAADLAGGAGDGDQPVAHVNEPSEP